VEDNCDALVCSYLMLRPLAESLGFNKNSPGLDEGPERVVRWTGTWGDLSTQSFYPPHHLTMVELAASYDHNYTYSHLGYNLKTLDPQAAIGRVQLRRLPEFIDARNQNWKTLRRGLAANEDVLEFALPTHATGWDPEQGFSWVTTGCRTV
jgi:CDP-6-deoxy-D-xylo-4-hexulose-3-dehydrase